jgi:hypothetical protein
LQRQLRQRRHAVQRATGRVCERARLGAKRIGRDCGEIRGVFEQAVEFDGGHAGHALGSTCDAAHRERARLHVALERLPQPFCLKCDRRRRGAQEPEQVQGHGGRHEQALQESNAENAHD